jgi:hypothetical protein
VVVITSHIFAFTTSHIFAFTTSHMSAAAPFKYEVFQYLTGKRRSRAKRRFVFLMA